MMRSWPSRDSKYVAASPTACSTPLGGLCSTHQLILYGLYYVICNIGCAAVSLDNLIFLVIAGGASFAVSFQIIVSIT